MTAIPAEYAPFIGLPYADKGRTRDGVDCWGFIRLVYADVAGITLPDYSDAYTRPGDHASVADAVDAGLKHNWQRVDRPRALDLLILRIAGRPWHCAVMTTRDTFAHCPPPGRNGHQSFSCIERLDNPQWAKRIEGFYRSTMAQSN